MATSRFSNNANLTYHTVLQVSDKASTEVIKEIKYYSTLPTIQTAVAMPDSVIFRDRGAIQGMEIGDDTVDFPEFSLEIDLALADLGGAGATSHADWFSIMNKFMSPAGDGDTTALTTTNTGSVNVKNGFDPTTVTVPVGIKAISIPADIDTLRLEILFTNGTEVFGYRWEQVQPIGVDFGGDMTATMTLKFKVWCAPLAINALTA